MRSLTARLPLFSLLLAVGVLAACEGEPTPRERLETAARAASADSSVAFTLDLTAKQAGGAGGMSVTGEGAYDRGHRRGHVTMEMAAMGLSMRILSRGDSTYVELPAAAVGAENQWVAGVVDDTVSHDSWSVDSTAVARLLDAAEGDITAIGSQELRGVQVDGFRVTVSPSEFVPEEAVEDLDAPEDEDPWAGMKIPIEVWIDADDRIRRVSTSVDMDPVAESATEAVSDTLAGGQRQAAGAMLASVADSLTLTVDLRDFGTEVTAEVPEDAEIMTTDELGEMMKQGQLGGAAQQPSGQPSPGTGG